MLYPNIDQWHLYCLIVNIMINHYHYFSCSSLFFFLAPWVLYRYSDLLSIDVDDILLQKYYPLPQHLGVRGPFPSLAASCPQLHATYQCTTGQTDEWSRETFTSLLQTSFCLVDNIFQCITLGKAMVAYKKHQQRKRKYSLINKESN